MRLRPRFSWGRYRVLEPDEGKLSSPVLRGLSGRKAAQLPGDRRFAETLPSQPMRQHTIPAFPLLFSSRISDDMSRICRPRTELLSSSSSAVRRRGLLARDLILEVIGIEAVEAAFGRFRLRIHEETNWRTVRPGQSDIM